MAWTVRLRAHGDGRILENATFTTPSAAMEAYRLLLDREDLVGQPLAAVFKPPRGAVDDGNIATWFSRFDRELGEGRIAGDDDRLDPWADANATSSALNERAPRAPAAVDWEADARPFSDCLKVWAKARGGRDAAAAALRVSRKTFDGWCDGRSAAQEAMARRLMTLIDRQ
ncbi:hypothetical protein MKK55_18055 [Methylobacterium sp. J-059]|uniref:hypothetical protein n=1 Tax=Methylobacterium sp. J-059 TaxID=2836643 RepID=UPI001FBA3BEA|nr:hypothetical protein [Methylobacterium sp. J-059]MCJ2040837.1 hypothetical protein [Methylobacterium sp. J-059]